MDYFYVEPGDVAAETLTLRGEEAKHLARVLRKEEGETVFASDGAGTMYECRIRSIGRGDVGCAIVTRHPMMNESKIEIAIAVSLLKNPSRMDTLVEKTTELGVRSILPMRCKRTLPVSEKQERLQKIGLAAMKQSGRCVVPKVEPVRAFEEILRVSGRYSLRLMPHEKTESRNFIGSILQHQPEFSSALILIGPEGGFSDEEAEAALAHGFVHVSLGARRLRSETAAMAAVSWIVGGW